MDGEKGTYIFAIKYKRLGFFTYTHTESEERLAQLVSLIHMSNNN